MMKTLLISCLLLALLPPAASLTCELCLSQGKSCKNATIQECNTAISRFCLSAFGDAKMGIFGSKFVFKSCVHALHCDTGYSSASVTSAMYILTRTYCCNTDMCNSETLELPKPEKRELNGLKCPSCYSFTTDQCQSKKTISCRNDEDHCFYYGGGISLGNTELKAAARGCATKNMCKIMGGIRDIGVENYRVQTTRAECFSANHSAYELLLREREQISNSQKNPQFRENGCLVKPPSL